MVPGAHLKIPRIPNEGELEGVGQQVEQRLAQAPAVGGQGADIALAVDPQRDVLAARALVAQQRPREAHDVLLDVGQGLAHTGRGHGTDKALMLGLQGERPDSVDPDAIDPLLESIRAERRILLNGERPIAFSEIDDLVFSDHYGQRSYEYIHAYQDLNLTLGSGIYGSTFFMLTGFHGFHVIVGTCFLAVCLVRTIKGHFKPDHHFGFEAAAWYWHFVDVVWLGLYVFVYWL